jgi:hypothetical protein
MITELGQAMAVAIGETTARRNAEIEVGRRRAEMMRMQAEMAVSHKDVMAMAFGQDHLDTRLDIATFTSCDCLLPFPGTATATTATTASCSCFHFGP